MSDRSFPSAVAKSAGWRLENTYAELSQAIHVRIPPVPVAAPRLVKLNRGLAESLGLDPAALESSAAEVFAGNALPPGSRPLAQAYAGHQYGHFTTLGDGRAVLLGEQITPRGGCFDIQLKGSGRTPFSRGGDGRAALGPMLREYLVSEAMHALGIPTTRSLAVAATGEEVWRQEGALPGAVLTRVAASHIRVGTFEAVPVARDREILRKLTDYTLRRHFPDRAGAENPALALLDGVIGRQAELIARWMAVGFVHGVMNTDNMALSGETIDYGPCAFMDAYDPATVFSSIDRHGRYAYGNQPAIAQWNLARFAETLLPLLHDEEKEAIAVATDAVGGFIPRYEDQWLAAMRRKLGIFNEEPGDRELVGELLEWMHRHAADFTNTFASMAREPDRAGDDCQPDEEFLRWRERWQARLERLPESPEKSTALRRAHNPAFIPRNHRVEEALAAAVAGDIGVFERLLEVVTAPYDHDRPAPEFRQPAPAGSAPYRTFCGT